MNQWVLAKKMEDHQQLLTTSIRKAFRAFCNLASLDIILKQVEEEKKSNKQEFSKHRWNSC
jgi:hypothetical protein